MDKYHLRRAILEALIANEPGVASPSDVLAYAPIEMSGVSLGDVMDELRGLVERQYVRNLKPGRSPLFRITGAGRGQIKKEDDLHEYVWGEWASKFQV